LIKLSIPNTRLKKLKNIKKEKKSLGAQSTLKSQFGLRLGLVPSRLHPIKTKNLAQ
jgi:hypothetical protein